MKQTVDKLRILVRLIASSIRGACRFWRAEIWPSDLDSSYCCDGKDCGCYGDSFRKMYLTDNKEPYL